MMAMHAVPFARLFSKKNSLSDWFVVSSRTLRFYTASIHHLWIYDLQQDGNAYISSSISSSSSIYVTETG